jgi:hypothetical protein
LAKWLVIFKAEVEAESIREAREKAIGVFGDFQNCRMKLLEFRKLKKGSGES